MGWDKTFRFVTRRNRFNGSSFQLGAHVVEIEHRCSFTDLLAQQRQRQVNDGSWSCRAWAELQLSVVTCVLVLTLPLICNICRFFQRHLQLWKPMHNTNTCYKIMSSFIEHVKFFYWSTYCIMLPSFLFIEK